MTILAIGDIHGKNIWRQAVDRIAADMIVFVGDYVNAKRWIFNRPIKANLEMLIKFKKENRSRVQLLLGNHDIPFYYRTSGLRSLLCPDLCRTYQDNKDCFEVAYGHDVLLFTHAGVSRSWYERHRDLIAEHPGETLAEKLNTLHRSQHYLVLHEKGRARGGNFPHGGITQADIIETEINGLNGYIQIVGHSKVPAPFKRDVGNASMIYIDCLNSHDQFLYIDGGQFSVVTSQGKHQELTILR